MAFIVHIQTICPVYRPKARGSCKCWTHRTCSIVYLGTCRKCIWNFYSAWAVRASEIPDRGNELPNLKFCRSRKCMSTVYISSMHFHRIRRILATLPDLLWAEQQLKYTTGREPGPLQPSRKGLNSLMKQSGEEISVSTARKAGAFVINWFHGNNLAAPGKCLEISGTHSCSFPAILTPMQDNWGGCHRCPRVVLLCIKGYRRPDTVSPMLKFPGRLLRQLSHKHVAKRMTGEGCVVRAWCPLTGQPHKSCQSSEEGTASLESVQSKLLGRWQIPKKNSSSDAVTYTKI